MTDLTQLTQQIEELSAESRAKLAAYIEFLQWQEHQKKVSEAKAWSFSFVEAYNKASTHSSDDPAGMELNLGPASVGGVSRPALWAHPPVVGQAIIEYHVPIPQNVYDVRLKVAIGIRDGAKIDEMNLVAFGVKANGARVWGQQTNRLQWEEAEIGLNLIAGDVARIEFTTEALGRHEWTWAVWGTPELSGKIRDNR